ncbi:MAG TPA: hypothetical protein V6D11_19385 [Waterburya sp.]
MLKFTRLAATVSTILLTLTTACSQGEPSQDASVTPASPKLTTSPPSRKPPKANSASPTPSPTTQPERFQEALDTGMGAAVIAQSATSRDDWNLVSTRWQTAINLLKTVPQSSQNYPTAQKKIAEYQRNLAYAQQQAKRVPKPTKTASLPLAAVPKPATPSPSATAPTTRQPLPSSPVTAPAPGQPSASAGVAELALAKHLKKVGAKLYGTYWCPYCNQQKVLFGEEAFSQINYIECDPRGKNARPALCRQAKIQGFPTWEIKGKFYSGLQTMQELSELSGYKGDRNFRS